MTVASEIARIKTNISNAYDSAEAKGATLPEQKNSENLAECIDSITGGGSEPVDYTTFRISDSMEVLDGTMSFDCSSFSPNIKIFFDFNKVKELSGDLRNFACNSGINAMLNVENIEVINGQNSFRNVLSYVNFVNGYTDIYFKKLRQIVSGGGSPLAFTFAWTNITSVHFESLVDIDNAAFTQFAFQTSGVHFYFNALNHNGTINNGSMVTLCLASSNQTLHFPSNMSDVIPTLGGYPNFGGTNTTILYDLPATE